MNYEKVKKIEHKIIEHRRHIHKYPELGFKEYKTHKYICNVLSNLKIKYDTVGDTGIVAVIGNKEKYKNNCIAFRAELDALPVAENTDLSFASTQKGVMHACGHDMHIAMLLGVAEIFQQKANELQGCIKLIFQPAEEVLPGGAKSMIKHGCLENPVPKMIFAQHINPDLEVGKFEASPREAMAATCEFIITVNGKATHGSTPYLGSDPLLVAANIINFAQSFISRYNNPLCPAVLSICANNGGTVNNAFPAEVKMLGTLRIFNEKQRNALLKKFSKKIELLCKVYDTTCDIDIVLGYPPVINDIHAFNTVKDSAIKLLKNKNDFNECSPKMWAEDFAYYAEKIPACFYLIGVKTNDATKEIYPLHSNKLNPSEDALCYGTALILEIAKKFFNSDF